MFQILGLDIWAMRGMVFKMDNHKIAGTLNMTDGNPKALILKFAIPIFLSQLFQQLYNIADTMIVGNFLGKSELAAVSSSGTLIFLIISMFGGIAAGAGVVVSKYFGAKDYENMQKAIHTNVAIGLFAGVFLTLFGVLATPTILRWMNTDPNVLPNSIVYFRSYFLGAMGIVMYNMFNGILNAMGDSKRPLIFLIVSSVLNVVLDITFIKVFHLGVGSVAAATAISQTLSALLCLRYLRKEGTIFRLRFSQIRFHQGFLGEILHMGIPSGVQNSVIAFANVIVQSNINSFYEDAMAGYGSYVKIEGFGFLPIVCFSLALSTYVSQNLGANRKDRVKEGANFGLFTAILMAEIIGITIFIAAPFLVSLFNMDPNVIAFGVKQARVEALFYFLLAFSNVVAGVFRGAGKAIYPMVVMLSVWCVFRILYITVAMQIRHDITLIYMAYPITWSISSILLFRLYIKGDWMSPKVNKKIVEQV